MNNINKLEQNIFVDENGKRWYKIRSKNYAVIGDDETLIGTATLFSSGKHGWFKYVDVEHGIEAAKHWDRATAKIFFEELLEIRLGKVYWKRRAVENKPKNPSSYARSSLKNDDHSRNSLLFSTQF